MREDCSADVSVDSIQTKGGKAVITFDISLSPCDDSSGSFEFDVHVSRGGQAPSPVRKTGRWTFRGEQSGSVEVSHDLGGGEAVTSVEVFAVECRCE